MPNSKHHKNNRNVAEEVPINENGNQVNNQRMEPHQVRPDNGTRFQQCCVPTGCNDDPIDTLEPMDSVKVACNNEACKEGTWMHKFCFIEWEQSVLSFLRSCGRARSWSEKQRLQNLWTKKGYDLAYKACDCKCGRGHLRKDLDYFARPSLNDNVRKVRKNKKKNDKPMPVVSTNHKSGHNHPLVNNQQVDNHPHHNTPQQQVDNAPKTLKKDTQTSGTLVLATHSKRRGSDNTINNNQTTPFVTTVPATQSKRRGSDNTINNNTSVTTAVGHFNSYTNNNDQGRTRNNSTNQNDRGNENEALDNSNHHGEYPNHSIMHSGLRLRTNSVSSTCSVGSQASSNGSISSSPGSISPLSSSPLNGNIFFKGKKVDMFDPMQQPGIFGHRQDLSAFCALPRYKQNPYNIHIEDVQEDEDTRNFVLSNLTTKRMTALRCVLCKNHLPVYDRFPLVDGTLFLSPQAYDQFVVQVIWEGRIQFLNAVCIGCLEGAAEAKCSACKKPWDGSSFVVGTMYTFDIFAAMPCCQKRLTCKHCRRAVIDMSMGLDYYSQYSRMIICPYCKANDYHFIRPLPDTFCVKDSICCQ